LDDERVKRALQVMEKMEDFQLVEFHSSFQNKKLAGIILI
jgi:hypothetical protein